MNHSNPPQQEVENHIMNAHNKILPQTAMNHQL
jgi:hypothetical protein